MSLILQENFELLKHLFTDCLNAKNSVKDPKVDLDEKLKIGSMEFVLIKKINRLVKYKVRSGREELQAQKTLVDCNRLHLQNLLYEVNYLKREIKHCYKFKSQDEDIDIYDTNKESTLSHKDRIERLEKELSLRKKLSDDCNKLLSDKNVIFNQIIIKMEILSTFAPSLRTLLKSTRPLQEALQMPIEIKWKLEHKVHLLPKDLYLAYVNLKAIEQLEGGFEIIVNGQEDELKLYEMKKTQSNQTSLLHSHPLSLQIKFIDQNFLNDNVTVRIYYLPSLDITTCNCEIHLSENHVSNSDSNVLQDFMKFIGEDDIGDAIPFSIPSLNLQTHKISLDEFHQKLTKHNLGKPYRWLQLLCGNSSFNNVKFNHNHILKLKDFASECVKKVKNYWHCRLILISQIRSFMNKNLDEYIDNKIGCTKPNCALVQWAEISWEEYEGSETTVELIKQSLSDDSCSFFRAVIVLGSAKMECLISISNKYPTNIPLWTITVHWNGHHNARNNSSIKIMEFYTNSFADSKAPFSNLLTKQLLRTMCSFDIFLETEGPLYQPLEYIKEKSFIKSFSKRIRVAISPYKKKSSSPCSSRNNSYVNKMFIEDSYGKYTYFQLCENSKRLSMQISNICGSKSNSTVAFFISPDVLTVVKLWATWMSGQIALPLSCEMSRHQYNCLLKKAKVSLIISSNSHEKFENLAFENNISLIRIDHRFLNFILEAKNYKSPVSVSLDEVCNNFGAIIAYSRKNICKTTLITRKVLEMKTKSAAEVWSMSRNDRVLHVYPSYCSYNYDYILNLLVPVSLGCQVNILLPFDLKYVWRTIMETNNLRKERFNTLIAEPKIFRRLILEYKKLFSGEKMAKEFIRYYCVYNIRLMIACCYRCDPIIISTWLKITMHQLQEGIYSSKIFDAIERKPCISLCIVNPKNKIILETRGIQHEGFNTSCRKTHEIQ